MTSAPMDMAVSDRIRCVASRVAAKDSPIPYSRGLEASLLPSVDRIVAQVHDVLYR